MNRWVLALAGLLTTGVSPAAVLAQSTEAEGAAALGLALRRLGTTKRVLMIAAHPDDENTAVLSTLALDGGADVAYLSLTRGEGGQNLIGPELQEGLGLIRSEELLAARRLDGAQQFFTRAYDYGFSKSADEAFSHWPADSLLADAVAIIRSFRPDIIISVFSGTPADGHGQHQAAGIIARRAFDAAGDAAVFPHLGAPHQARYLYQSRWRPTGEERIALQTGQLDPLLGRSHYQVAMASRSRHRSQDMGQAQPVGPRSSAFALMAGERPGDDGSLFVGIDTTVAAHAAALPDGPARLLRAYQDSVRAIRDAYNPLRPGALVPRLAAAHALLARAQQAGNDDRTRFLLEDERAELNSALIAAAGVVLDATADRAWVVPGESFTLTLTAWNGGEHGLDLIGLAPVLPAGWTTNPPTDAVRSVFESGAVVTRTFDVRVPANARVSEPYFLREARTGDLYAWPDDAAVRGLPFEPDAVRATIAVGFADGVVARGTEPATFLEIDKAFGERRMPLRVVPAISVAVEPRVLVMPADAPAGARRRTVTVSLRSAAHDTIRGSIDVAAPQGWRSSGDVPRIALAPGATERVAVTLEPIDAPAAGHDVVRVALAADDGRVFDRGYEVIDYPHIRPRLLFHPAQATVAALDVAIAPDLAVGYIEGAGDDGAEALRQLGARVVQLDSAALASGDLAAYDAIVAGIRAYEVRTDLIRHNARLLEYARAGGTFVVQYNKYELVEGGFAPFALTMDRPHGRVTDESAPVSLQLPEHRVLAWPNRITERDFDGWVHERGLYFAETWDEAYAAPLSMSDPNEAPLAGSLLVAPYGRGHYVYTGLAFFRQLPEAVPGAYRLLANLVSLGERAVP